MQQGLLFLLQGSLSPAPIIAGPDHCKRYRVGQNPLDAAEGSVQRCEAAISPREAWKKFHLHFSVIRIGSRGTFVLCTASSRCKRIAGPAAAMCARTTYRSQACAPLRSDEKPGGAYSLYRSQAPGNEAMTRSRVRVRVSID